jgi:EmrB/QacA subfamily drug resistance transporter
MRLVAWLVAATLFMEFLDGTVITTALPAMAKSFGVAPIDLNIGISAYLFALAVFIPVSSWAADRFGARLVFMSAILLFTAASLLCGLAGNLSSFVLLRVLQGVGGAMLVPVGRLIVLRYTPKERVISAVATLVWPALIAPVTGPAIGGFLAAYANWRWIFYLNIPLGIAALTVAFFVVPDIRAEQRRRFDWLGFFLCGTGILLFLYGVELVARVDANFSLALVCIAGGAALLACAIVHLRRASVPLLDLKAFSNPTFATALRGGSLMRAAIGSAPFLLPLMFQVGFGFDAFYSGMLVAAVFVGNLAMKTVTTPILKRFGFRRVLVWNGLLCILSLLACAILMRDTPLPVILAILFAGGLVRSMQFTAINTIAFADVPQTEMTSANALFSTVFQLSLGAGVAVGAVALRLGGLLSNWLGNSFSHGEYSVAFVLVSLLAAAGLVDALRLSPHAGIGLTGRTAT